MALSYEKIADPCPIPSRGDLTFFLTSLD